MWTREGERERKRMTHRRCRGGCRHLRWLKQQQLSQNLWMIMWNWITYHLIDWLTDWLWLTWVHLSVAPHNIPTFCFEKESIVAICGQNYLVFLFSQIRWVEYWLIKNKNERCFQYLVQGSRFKTNTSCQIHVYNFFYYCFRLVTTTIDWWNVIWYHWTILTLIWSSSLDRG